MELSCMKLIYLVCRQCQNIILQLCLIIADYHVKLRLFPIPNIDGAMHTAPY